MLGELDNLFHQMLRIRLVEERIAEEYPKQEMRCPVHLSIGQEAVAVGVCSALRMQDDVMSGHRSHAHYLAKGGDLKAMISEIMGKETGCASGFGGSMHLIDRSVGFRGAIPIVGSTIPIATGLAFQHRLDKDGAVVAVFFGEGATEQGVFAESLNFASLWNLPVIFVCENNLYSVYSPLSVRQASSRSILKMGESQGIESLHGDGNDVQEVLGLSAEAVDKARNGAGPSLLVLDTYRWLEHCGPNYDNDIGYRTQSEFEEWKTKCPIQKIKPSIAMDQRAEIEKCIASEIEQAFQYSRIQSYAEHEDLRSFVFKKNG